MDTTKAPALVSSTSARDSEPVETGSNPLAELRESSLLFSLESLLKTERTRVEEERLAAERQRAAEEAERAAELQRKTEAEARREAEARARALRAEQQRREEEARLDGIRRAEVERAAAEARLRGEIELAARKSEHELRLTAIRATGQARTVQTALFGASLVAVFALVGALVLEFGIRRPELARMQAHLDAQLSAERARTGRVQVLLEESERRAKKLEQNLLESREVPVPPLAASSTSVPRSAPPRVRPPPRGAKPRVPCRGSPDDPLNPCL